RRADDLPAIGWMDGAASGAQLRKLVEGESFGALGVLSATMRWGGHERLEAAMDKLTAVAKFMLNGHDPYSGMRAKLVAEVGKTFTSTSLREHLNWMPNQLDNDGKIAVERYLRQAYRSCKTQAWPSQQRGIERLEGGASFVLCTPTGSGKTTVAEI